MQKGGLYWLQQRQLMSAVLYSLQSSTSLQIHTHVVNCSHLFHLHMPHHSFEA